MDFFRTVGEKLGEIFGVARASGLSVDPDAAAGEALRSAQSVRAKLEAEDKRARRRARNLAGRP